MFIGLSVLLSAIISLYALFGTISNLLKIDLASGWIEDAIENFENKQELKQIIKERKKELKDKQREQRSNNNTGRYLSDKKKLKEATR